MACAGGQDEWSAALLVPVLNVGPVVDEELNEFVMTPRGCQCQRRVVIGFCLLVNVNGRLERAQW